MFLPKNELKRPFSTQKLDFHQKYETQAKTILHTGRSKLNFTNALLVMRVASLVKANALVRLCCEFINRSVLQQTKAATAALKNSSGGISDAPKTETVKVSSRQKSKERASRQNSAPMQLRSGQQQLSHQILRSLLKIGSKCREMAKNGRKW